jgi:hypothetical protein
MPVFALTPNNHEQLAFLKNTIGLNVEKEVYSLKRYQGSVC